MKPQAKKWIQIWLMAGVILVFVQVILGGITRLTDSGLSITEWNLVKGVLPPTNEEEWSYAFEEYQFHAQKQFESIHSEMTLPEFKRIYFWEWFHRLWARSMGIVFIIPFLIFLYLKWMPNWLLKRLGIVVAIAALAGAFGWIMVASGLNNDNRTWVSAYKLAAHLLIATTLFAYLFNTFLIVFNYNTKKHESLPLMKKTIMAFIVLCLIQITLGAFMAGMHAGAVHPHWPFFMGNNHLMQIVANPSLIQEQELINYEGSVWIKGVVQVFHRMVAVFLFVLAIFVFLKSKHLPQVLKNTSWLILLIVLAQFAVGVLTITNIIGNKTPVFLGVFHQAMALLVLASLLVYFYFAKEKNY